MVGRLTGISVLLAVALGGCDGGAPDNGQTRTIKVAASNPFADRMKGLGTLNRDLALRRAIQDSGGACKRIESSGFQEDYKNLSMWTARCSDGKQWSVYIAPNGDVQVRDCADAATLGLPACRLEEGGSAE